MNKFAAALGFSLLAAGLMAPVQAQERRHGAVYIPETSYRDPADRGERAHTNHRELVQPEGGLGPSGGMTPAQIRSFYNLPSTGGQGLIAIVDAYDYPNALRDFNTFSKQFGLPTETSNNSLSSANKVFQVVYQGNRQPRFNVGWAQEAALDVQWAHALAPNAKIVLVEAQSNSFGNLLAAVDLARSLPGVTQVSMSWGGGEFSGETSYDAHFNVDGPIFFASSGDAGGVTGWPAASPYVVAVGGTSVATDSSGAFVSESGWSDAGGGPSSVEPRPSWQGGVPVAGSSRLIPDLAADADPQTGVAVYAPRSSKSSAWVVFGGTSVSSPCMAAMVNLSGLTFKNTTAFLQAVYAVPGSANFRDIVSGSNGYPCTAGWDYVTGLGSPLGLGF